METGTKKYESLFDLSVLMKGLFQLLSCGGGASSCAQCRDLQTHSCRSALFNTVTINHRALLTFPKK